MAMVEYKGEKLMAHFKKNGEIFVYAEVDVPTTIGTVVKEGKGYRATSAEFPEVSAYAPTRKIATSEMMNRSERERRVRAEQKPEPTAPKEEKTLFVIEGLGAVTTQTFGDERDRILDRMWAIWRELKELSIGVIVESYTLGQYRKRAQVVLDDASAPKAKKTKAQKILDLVKEQLENSARYHELCEAAN